LQKYLRAPPGVLAFGSSGASMADYLAVAEVIPRRFTPLWAVVVISDGDFVDGYRPANGYYRWNRQSDPLVVLDRTEGERSTLKKWARTLAIVRYVRYNLKASLGRLFDFSFAPAPAEGASRCRPQSLAQDDLAVIGRFVKQLPQTLSVDPSHVILVFDSDRRAMHTAEAKTPEPCPTRDALAQQQLREDARLFGIHIIETRPLFERFYLSTHRPLDYFPEDLHWNSNAHRLVAQSVAAIINNQH
jgi:hypothetical protein